MSTEAVEVYESPLSADTVLSHARLYPQLRFMGSKHRLLPWLHEVLRDYSFETVLDPFCGSGAVSYLFKCMGKSVTSSDFLHFCFTIAQATIENNSATLSPSFVSRLCESNGEDCTSFIRDTFDGIFFSRSDLMFLDRVWCNLRRSRSRYARALAISALLRACVKRQPRGVFTVSGNSNRYDDGRRDLRLNLEEHFLEQVESYNETVFDNGHSSRALHKNVFALQAADLDVDLVYLDPPYVPRSDDNCYVKRYHFLEGLSHYWKGERILYNTKVRKIPKKYTPFSYRQQAIPAFQQMFKMFCRSTIVLSYSSNGYPDLDILVGLMRKVKKRVVVEEHPHRYHFGTHSKVKRALATEYLVVGTN